MLLSILLLSIASIGNSLAIIFLVVRFRREFHDEVDYRSVRSRDMI